MVLGLELGSSYINYIVFGNNILKLRHSPYYKDDVVVLQEGSIPIKGNMANALNELLSHLKTCNITHVGVNKSYGNIIVNQIKNIESLRNFYYSEYSTIIDMGSRRTNIYTFEGQKLVNTYSNGKCAAGSGSFIETMAQRLGYSLADFINLSLSTKDFASLSGRCAVFCESDIVHLFQKGITSDKIAHGITRNVAQSVKNILGKTPLGSRALFVGGVSNNKAVYEDLKSLYPNTPIDLGKANFNAFASIFSCVEMDKEGLYKLLESFMHTSPLLYDKPLKLEKSTPYIKENNVIIDYTCEKAALGVDIGSVSTKAALITIEDNKPKILAHYYRKTLGNPLNATKDVISHIYNTINQNRIKVNKIYVGCTGSGRYLTSDFLGGDLIKNEITAQVAGVVSFYPETDTIFEIGGQDSKYISLKDGEIIDFEMNRVCAAGTGAFLEKQANILGVDINDFGDLALENTNPPDFDYNCTVFTEMALKDLLGRVAPSDLAGAVCLASSKNYINKNVDGRKIGDNIVFSGAVAFNKGMVAAFENLTNKEIKVSPYPHINGAIGVAYLALTQCNEEPKFKGFRNIINEEYSLSSFKCTSCENYCDVSLFQKDDKKFYYNDRCEKYSGKQDGNYQVNLFDKYEELMEENLNRVPILSINNKTIGYPRGMLFNEYYVLFASFFKACGFNVITSDKTNKKIAQEGSLSAGSKPCFPMKVAFGHFENIMSKNTNYIFMPRIITGEVVNNKTTHYCPFIQSGPDLIVQRGQLKGLQNNMDRPIEESDKILTPTFYMSEPSLKIKKILEDIGVALGVDKKISHKASYIAFDAFWDFKDDLARTGKNIMELYKDYIYVVLGHPYVLYDKYLNMNIGDKLSKMGYMPVPMDFIVQRRGTNWHIYQKEIEKKLELGAYLRDKKNIKSIVLSYFACGMDAFSNKFYREELGHSTYIMNLDEHTSDAGVQTRLEAFADVQKTPSQNKKPNVSISGFDKIKGKKLWLPSTDYSSEILARAFNLYGIDAQVLEEGDTNFNRARREISEDVCLPCLATMEDMLKRCESEDFDPKREVFFQAGANGPCRLGMYPQRQKLSLKAPITIIDNNFFKSKLSIGFIFLAWNSLLLHDLIFKLYLHSKPYETEEGKADRLYSKYSYALNNTMKLAKRYIEKVKVKNIISVPVFENLLQEACEEFEAYSDHSVKKPIIGITGEFYIKLNNRSNKNIIEYIQNKGFEVYMSNLTEYFHYSNYISLDLLNKKLDNIKLFEKLGFLDLLTQKLFREMTQNKIELFENRYNGIINMYVDGMCDLGSRELVQLGEKHLHKSVTGEAICSIGKAGEFFYKNLAGIINIAPFNCMPGNIVDMLVEPFRKEHENIPFLSLSYDGFETNYEKIDNFLDNI